MSGSFKFVTVIGLFVFFVGLSESANILGMFTSHSPSHLIVHMSYIRALVERGHNVTVVTALPLKDKNPGYHHIYIPITEARTKEMNELKSKMTKAKSGIETVWNTVKTVMAFAPSQTDIIKNQRFQDFMHNPDNKFDLMIMGYFLSDYQIGLGQHFKCPVVISWMSATNLLVDRYIGNPLEVSYVPSSPMFGKQDSKTFKGRLTNFGGTVFIKLMSFFVQSQMDGLYNELFPAPDYPSLEKASKKVSLVLCNSHFSEGLIRPNVPALIDAGGIQIKDKPDPLPKDLEGIVNASSEHGVIFVSFGSNLDSDDINKETLECIFKVLSGLKQTVLWKWNDADKPGIASNIHYRKWLPQDDLLAHPNMKLFITHAGKGSVAESQYHGVPMVAIPIFGDQFGNAAELTDAGFGLQVKQNTMTPETLTGALLEVLENPKYRENVKQFSVLYRDRPMSARETAVYWIEYVIRHNGAYHMQSPLVHLNGLQYISADVVAFLLLVIYLVYKLIRISSKFVLRKVCRKRKVKAQ